MGVRQNAKESVAARRLKGPSWKDPKFLAGVLLMLTSIVGVIVLVSTMRSTQEFFALKKDVSAGEKLSADALIAVDANLGAAQPQYVLAKDTLGDNPVMLKAQKAGSLLERVNVGKESQLERKPVGIDVNTPLLSELSSGDTVEVWVAEPGESNSFGEPTRIVASAPVAEIRRPDSNFASNRDTSVQLLLSDQELPPVLRALNSGAKISLIPSHGPSTP